MTTNHSPVTPTSGGVAYFAPGEHPPAPRHPGVQSLLAFFDYAHLPPDLAVISEHVHDLATELLHALPDSAEFTAGLRKLLEAKDCFVRAAVEANR